MIRNILKKISLVAAFACIMSTFTGCSQNNNEASGKTQVFHENITGTADGYDYELWKDEGDTTFNVESGGGNF